MSRRERSPVEPSIVARVRPGPAPVVPAHDEEVFPLYGQRFGRAAAGGGGAAHLRLGAGDGLPPGRADAGAAASPPGWPGADRGHGELARPPVAGPHAPARRHRRRAGVPARPQSARPAALRQRDVRPGAVQPGAGRGSRPPRAPDRAFAGGPPPRAGVVDPAAAGHLRRGAGSDGRGAAGPGPRRGPRRRWTVTATTCPTATPWPRELEQLGLHGGGGARWRAGSCCSPAAASSSTPR